MTDRQGMPSCVLMRSTRIERRQLLLSVLVPLICLASTSLAGATELKPERLAKLVQRGRATHSTALLVWYHGKLVADETFGGKPHPGPMMSMTKSIVALAVARLVDEGKLRLDEPVADFYPEWKQGQKQKVTIRHILTHT